MPNPRRVLLVLAMTLLAGCFRYQPVGRLRDGQRLPPSTRVVTYRRDTTVFANARLVNDTIIGYALHRSLRIEIPLAAVDVIETKRFHERDTIVAVGVLALAVYLVPQIMSLSTPATPMVASPLP